MNARPIGRLVIVEITLTVAEAEQLLAERDALRSNAASLYDLVSRVVNAVEAGA